MSNERINQQADPTSAAPAGGAALPAAEAAAVTAQLGEDPR